MKKEKRVYLIFALMVTIQLFAIIYSFQFRKEGIHSDEVWSYGYANGFYSREIFMDDEQNLINTNEWLPCKQLWDYLVVNEGEEFRFDSVYYNKQNDVSPFLHSMILHAICSFFPESFSLWYSFLINIVSFLICMIFLFKTARLLKNDTFALGCCFWYGFSLAARDTYIYLRMYAMSAAIIMAYVYFSVKYIKEVKEEKKPSPLNLLILIMIAWIGFLSNFYNISFIGITTFFICVYLLFSKKIKYMFAYGFSMLAALGGSVLMFPNLFDTTKNFGEEVNGVSTTYSFSMQIKVFLNAIFSKLCGIRISIYHTATLAIIGGVLVYLFIVMIPFFFLIRNTDFAKKCVSKIKYVATHKRECVRSLWKRINWIYVIFIATMLLQIIIVCKTSYVEAMGAYVDRYIFFLYPVAALVLFACLYSVLYALLRKQFVKRYAFAALLLVLFGVNMYTRMSLQSYLFKSHREGKSIEEVVEGKDCIFINSAAWEIVAMSKYLMHGKNYFHTSMKYQEYTKEYKDKLSQGPVVLIINTEYFTTMEELYKNLLSVHHVWDDSVEDDKTEKEKEMPKEYYEMLDYFEALVPETEMQQVSTEDVFDREMHVFIINP